MWFDRILCLANSYKHDHRCVAGMSLITKKWIRLVGRQVPGCLTRRETSYPDGTEVALLDVFEAEFDEKCGTSFHPEDIYVNRNRWRRIRRFDEPSDARRLLGFISNDQSVLQGYDDSVSASSVMESPLERSLELIHTLRTFGGGFGRTGANEGTVPFFASTHPAESATTWR